MINTQLKVPTTERTQHLLLDANSKSLAAEIRDLPYVDIPSALLLVHRKLHSFNRFALSPAKRLQVVGPFHYAFQRFVDYYRKQFSGGLFAKELNANDLENLMDFIQELGFAYKHIVQDTLSKNRKPAGLATAIYMAMNYQYYYAIFSFNRGRMLTPSYWKDIHHLYFLASELGQENTSIATPEERDVTVSQLYKRCILMGLSSPHAMTAEDQWRTADYLHRFANLLQLTVPDSIGMVAESYHVIGGCQRPANIPSYEDCSIPLLDDCRVLDLSRLLETLHRQHQGVKSGDSPQSVQLQQMPRPQAIEFLSNLYDSWSHNTQRQYQRTPIDEQIGLVWGLENICRMLDPEHRRVANLESRNDGAEKRAWSRGRDESATGIRVTLSGAVSPEPGQVVAMIRKRQDSKILQVGMVKWAAISRDESPQCGIKLLRGNIKKIAIQHPEDQDDRRNGLLILQRSKRDGRTHALVVSPNGLLKTGTETGITSSDQYSYQAMKVENATQHSRQVNVFSIKLVEN